MLYRASRLFVIKNKIEASVIILALADGAIERGKHYLAVLPGAWGIALFCACLLAVFMAGGRILDGVRSYRRERDGHKLSL